MLPGVAGGGAGRKEGHQQPVIPPEQPLLPSPRDALHWTQLRTTH